VSSKNLKTLAALIVVLVAIYFVMNKGGGSQSSDDQLLPELRSQINDVTAVSVASNAAQVDITNTGDTWTLPARDGFSANVGKLREVLIALADAEIVEMKTSNPDNYSILGVDDFSTEGSEATLISISGNDFEYGVILGKAAQGDYRYARLANQAQSVLINQNPELPDSVGGWTDSLLLDIASAEIQGITISHSDGERIEILKVAKEDTNFVVNNVPDDRELTYETVANSIGGVLAGLALDDVRKSAAESNPDVTAAFTMFDGLTITVTTQSDEESSWVSIAATGDSPTLSADEINSRHASWQYTVPEHKANLLKRRFEEILRPLDDDE
jgi:hypothetical protein